MADQTGPFTLEEIETLFGYTSIEDIPFSLDSSVWQTATIFDGSASASSSATSTVSAIRQRIADASISAAATVSALSLIHI